MPRFADHQVEFWVFAALFGFVIGLGFVAARWRRPPTMHDLEQWGLGGRAFGNWVTWFLIGGDLYTAYTFVAVPALVYAVGGQGFFAVGFALVATPIVYVFAIRLWSVAHAHGFVTPAEFVRARFDSRWLAGAVALTGIVATMPYVALQLIGIEAVLAAMGITGTWPLTAAFALLALCTFRSGLRAPALISIAKDVLLLWTALAALLVVSMTAGGYRGMFHAASARFARTPSPLDGLLLAPGSRAGYVTLILGSALGLFLYPHAVTGILAARNRATVQRNIAAVPVYALVLAVMALLGYVAIAFGVKPVGGDLNTVVPVLFDTMFPPWCAGVAYAAIGVGALVPAAIMSIAAANLFTRSIYREFIRPGASAAAETRVSRWTSLAVKFGAVCFILFLDPQFSVDLQLVGGVVILQTLPAVGIGLYSAWLHRYALLGGLGAGLATGVVLLYRTPQYGPDGRTVVRSHFGGSEWPLAHLGLHTQSSVYIGLVALAVNVAVAVVGTLVVRALAVVDGIDRTVPQDYVADGDDETIDRMSELIDGEVRADGAHALR
jgi:solute:Na+ symporter, SSS family